MEYSDIFEAIETKSDDTPSKTLKAIKNGNDVNLKNEYGENFLHIIANIYSGENDSPFLIPVVFQLSIAGIKKNDKNHNGETALHVAVQKFGMHALVRALLMIGVDPRVSSNNGEDIKEAIDKADTRTKTCVQLLYPGLWNAVELEQDELVLRLVSSWCDLEETREGKSIMNLIHLNVNEKTVNMIEKSLPTRNLVYAALSRDKKMLKKALKDPNADINTRNVSYIGYNNSVFFMPLVGEVALLHLTSCLEKLLVCGADVNVIVDEVGSAEPLFLYVLKALPPTEDAYDILEILLPYANFSLCKKQTPMICSIAFEKRLPFSVVKLMISQGLNLFGRDESGLTLRDKIYLENFQQSKESLRFRLGFVDQILVDIALERDMELLEKLCLNSYDYDQVKSKQGVPLIEAVSEKGHTDVVRFLEGLPELQRTIRRLHVAIENGNLHEIKQHMINRLAVCRDKGGRGLLHKAVLYERRFIIKYFLKEYPQMVHIRDFAYVTQTLVSFKKYMPPPLPYFKCGRTPLHWAVCFKDGTDIEDCLTKCGANMMAKDKKGRTPIDYKNMADAMLEVIQKERATDYGIEVYLLQRYMEFKFAIESGSLSKVEETRNNMYKDISLNDVHVKMYQTTPPPRDLLSLCVDNKQDKIGKYLLSQGIDWDIQYMDGEGEMSMEVAVHKKGMLNTAEAVEYQKSRAEEEKKVITKVKKEKKAVIEKQKKAGTYESYLLKPFVNGNNNNNRSVDNKFNNNINNKDTEGQTKSSSCILL